jgi:stage V sporulation protein D (sporulation-specific penicillin-binding protein)
MDFAKRLRLLFTIIFALFMIVVIRLIWVQIIRHDYFTRLSLDQRTRIINLPSLRGDILDRNGNVLATSIDTFSAFVQKPRFVWLARRLPSAEAEKLRATDPVNIILYKEKKRIYPKGAVAAQLLGFVGADNQGLSGIELAFDRYLKGKEGKVVTEGDPAGRELYGALRVIEPGEEGQSLTLTIDENIQYIAEREIVRQIRQSKAVSGMLLVMDAKTGEILALASKPDFDPNDYKQAIAKRWHPAFLDPYEPGSTFKVISTAAGLEEKVVTPDSQLNAMDKLEIGGKVIENSHAIKWPGPRISISFMLQQSINTAMAQVGLKLGPERFYRRIRKFGFGELTGFGLAGESKGIVRYWENWYKPDPAMISFGQSIAVTPLQLLRAYSAFANHGRLVAPYIVKKIESNDGRFVKMFGEDPQGQAVSDRTAEEILKLMSDVVLYGSGRRAQLEYFTVGGKTGTAQKAAPGGRGYLKGHYIASFIGIVPLSEPRLICLVIVDDPQGSIWGESVAGPSFKTVMEYALRYLNVKPDVI